jgi:deazaflavin-dependent oxidoreductase (nitroreductase family)
MSVVNRNVLLNRDRARTVRAMSQSTLSLPAGAARAESLPIAIRVLRRLNPAIAWVLRSPLHGVVSRDLLLLTYVGAKSGVTRTLPLSYVEVGGRIYLCTRSSAWWRNLRNGRPVELRFRGRLLTATPVVLDTGTTEALDAFRAFLTANPKTGEMLYEVGSGRDRRPVEEDLRREVQRSVVVRLDAA